MAGLVVVVCAARRLIRESLVDALATRPAVAAALPAANVEEARRAVRGGASVAALDVDTGVFTDLTALSTLGAPVLLLGGSPDAQLVARAVQRGASGHARCDVALPELVRLLGCATAGELALPDDLVLPVLNEVALLRQRDRERDELLGRLTTRELEVLRLLAEGRGRGEIADLLWRSPHTVRSHLVRVFRKLGSPNEVAAAARGRELLASSGVSPAKSRSVPDRDGPVGGVNTVYEAEPLPPRRPKARAVTVVGRSRTYVEAFAAALGEESAYCTLPVSGPDAVTSRTARGLTGVLVLTLFGDPGDDALVTSVTASASAAKILLIFPRESLASVLLGPRDRVVGYLTLDHSLPEMRQAVRSVASGRYVVPIDVVRPHPTVAAADDVPKLLILSARQRQVLRAITIGHTTTEIAAELGLGVSTVRSHIKAVLRKLGVHSRLQAAGLAAREGLV